MLRTLAMNFSQIFDKKLLEKLLESMDLSPKQEDKCVKDARKAGANLLQYASYCVG
ncbi:hypothetical protein [Prevotella brunnea]|uniref:hypothetical protein n=1 Tax=Prevotella brunnea TaxID=2508867 RepID=UPI00283A9D74|nr:hypothetical protein [Prevotella brunnea]